MIVRSDLLAHLILLGVRVTVEMARGEMFRHDGVTGDDQGRVGVRAVFL